MGLRIKLKPFERLLINGVSIRNGDRNSDFLIETHCNFLRESEIIHESDADTACKKLCVTLQALYLSDEKLEIETLFYAQASDIMKSLPSSATFMASIQTAIEEQHFHKAIKFCKQLIAHEQEALGSTCLS